MNIPIVGYIVRELKENLGLIKKVQRTGKERAGRIKYGHFLWIFRIVSRKRFKPLFSEFFKSKIAKKNGREKR